jgi:predicted transcriptional regulator
LGAKTDNSVAPLYAMVKGKYANNFSVNVIMRILCILEQDGRIKRTNLAGRSGLNYNKCIGYINLLDQLGWINLVFDAGVWFVSISRQGIEVIDRLAAPRGNLLSLT